ncbi:2-amino-4-hydroxy-6-hydroxymethyldihydropteridine diphosphokinase [Planctomycetota bacterium]
MDKPIRVYIGLGSNLGDRKVNIDSAVQCLADTEQVEVVRVSDIVETAPLASTNQSNYLNAVVEIRTGLSPIQLRKRIVEIEAALGRIRRGKWWPRTIDLDILLFGDQIMDTAELTIPHTQMHLRSFVLEGLCQLDAGLVHPVLNVPVGELKARLNGGDFALDADKPQLVSIAGNIGVGKTTLARKLAGRFDCEVLLEPYDVNPFLPDVYAGRKELALDSQLFFLLHRSEQLNPSGLAQDRMSISDYVFDKELIYARRLLEAQQLVLYEEIYPPFAEKVAAPVLVIYMRDPAAECLKRIHSRNLPYEQRIELPFLEALGADYDHLFEDWTQCPVIRISTSQAADVDHLAHQVKYYKVSF